MRSENAYASTEPPKVGTAPPTAYLLPTQDTAIDAPGTNDPCKLNPLLTRRTEKVLEGEHSHPPGETPPMATTISESTPDSIERDNILTTENCSESRVWTNSIKLDYGQPMIKQLEFDMIAFMVQPEPIYRMRQETFAWEPGSRG